MRICTHAALAAIAVSTVTTLGYGLSLDSRSTISNTAPANHLQLTNNLIKPGHLLEDGIRALEIDTTGLAALRAEARSKGVLSLTNIPLADGTTVSLDLRESNPIKPGAKFTLQSSSDPATAISRPLIADDDMLILTGCVQGEPKSFAMLALSPKGCFGMIQSSKGNSIISSSKMDGKNPVIYDPAIARDGLFNMTEFNCGASDPHFEIDTPDLDNPGVPFDGGAACDGVTCDHDHSHAPAQAATGGLAGANECKVVDIALEYDNEMWTQSLGADNWKALFYTVALMASIDEIYRRDVGIGVRVSNVRIWYDADDPWDGANNDEQLDQLRDWYIVNGDDIDRDAVVFCSARNSGGLAWVGGLCNGWGYSVCSGMNGTFPYPLEEYNGGNWDINVVAHELGHNLGTSHTHNYCPPIDQCASAIWFGSCQAVQVCQTGTIMSYCQLCPGGFNNVALSFHPTVATKIFDYVTSKGCVNDVDSAVTGVNDTSETLMNTRVLIDVLQNDDATCSEVTIALNDAASLQGGKIALSSGSGAFGRNELRYQPPAGFIGEDTFGYVATNAFGDVDLATVTVNVTPQADGPDVLVADVAMNLVQRYSYETGEFLGTLIPSGEGGLDMGQSPCVGPDGDVFVASYKNDYVLRYDGTTGVSMNWFYGGDVIDAPNDLQADFNQVYVSARDAEQVVVIKASGNVGWIYPINGRPNDIQLDESGDRLWVAWGSGNFGGGVQIWSTQQHQLIDSFATPQLQDTTAVCLLPDGDILVGDYSGQAIARFDSATGQFSNWFMNSAGSAAFGIGSPNRVELSPDGMVYVTSPSGFHKFDQNGFFQGTIDSTDESRLSWPRGMYFRPPGIILVGDINNDGIVNGADLSTLLGAWGAGASRSDLNHDGLVDGADLSVLLGNWSS